MIHAMMKEHSMGSGIKRLPRLAQLPRRKQPPDMARHLLELRQVVKHYTTDSGFVPALKGVSLTVERGEFVAVLGKSGSGKTTLLNVLAGIDRPTSGEVLVDGLDLQTLTEDELTIWRGKNVGVIFQSFQLLPTLTVLENVMLPMDFRDTCHPATFRSRAGQLLEQFEMQAHMHKLPSAISGGQQQRVAIARALANNPPLIVADEPTGSLDYQTADVVVRIFEDLAANGTAVLMVTHDRDLANRATRKILLADGLIMQQAASDTETVPDDSRATLMGDTEGAALAVHA